MNQPQILVVEDENIVALDIKMRLERFGCQVIATVPSGEEAIQQAAKIKPDLILMDIKLRGELDGIDTARQIQSQMRIPIIFLTAFVDEPTIQRAINAEPFGYILKPFDERELNLVIQVTLFRHQMEERLRASEAAERKQRALAEALSDIANTLNSTLELKKIVVSILKGADRLITCHHVSLLLVSDPRTVYAAGVNDKKQGLYIASKPEHFFSHAQIPILATMTTSREPLVIPDTRLFDGWPHIPETEDVLSFIGIPLFSQNELLGFINISSHDLNAYKDYPTTSLQTFAEQAAIALSNASLHQATHAYAGLLEQRVAQRTEELEQEKNRLQLILDGVGDAIYFTDTDFLIQYANAKTEIMTGYLFSEMANQTPELWRGPTPTIQILEMVQTLRQGEAWQGEVINRRKDGTLFPAALNVRLLHNSENELTGYICVQRNLTETKELVQLKEQFFSRIGHELRTPLTNVKLYLDLMERSAPDKWSYYHHIIEHETTRLEKLITGFLEISNLQLETGPHETKQVNLNQMLGETLAYYAELAAVKGLIWRTEFAENLPPVAINPPLLIRALNPVIDNALTYTPTQGEILLQTTTQLHQNQMWCTVSVRDSGPGISEEEEMNIYKQFYRGEAAKDFKTAGAGLGLSICKEIMGRLNGRLTLTSIPGHGSTFTLWLPIANL